MNESLDRQVADWIREGPDRPADDARQRALAEVRAVGQRRAWVVSTVGGAESSGSSPYPPRRVLLALVVLGLALATILGGAVAGGFLDGRPRETVTTLVDAGPSAPPVAPSVGPSTEPSAPPATTRTFNSSRYAYALPYPDDWIAREATSEWRLTEPWDDPSSADTFTGVQRLTVVSAVVPDGWTADDWVAAYAPGTRSNGRIDWGCSTSGAGIGDGIVTGPDAWTESLIGGHPGIVRGNCGYVDGVAVVDGRIYVVSLFTGSGTLMYYRDFRIGGDVFRAFANTIQLSEPVVVGPPEVFESRTTSSETFVSNLYRYSIRYPAGWVSEPATAPWSGTEQLWATGVADVITGSPISSGMSPDAGFWRIQIAAHPIAEGETIDDWIGSHQGAVTPYGFLDDRPICRVRLEGGSGSHMFPAGSGMFLPATIGGQPARVRAQCGYVTAVIFAQGRAYAISAFTGLAPGAQTRLFETFADTMTFGDASPATPPTARYTSPWHGYSIGSGDFTVATPALFDWDGGTRGGFDVFETWWGETIRIASIALPDGRSLPAWKSEYVTECRPGVPASWRSVKVAGLDASVASGCFERVAAYLVHGDRFYAFTTDGGDEASLLAFLSTIELRPEAAHDAP